MSSAAHRISLCALRRPPWPCLQRRPAAHRETLVQQRHRSEVYSEVRQDLIVCRIGIVASPGVSLKCNHQFGERDTLTLHHERSQARHSTYDRQVGFYALRSNLSERAGEDLPRRCCLLWFLLTGELCEKRCRRFNPVRPDTGHLE